MILGGLDIATTTGLAVARGQTITASSYRPRAERTEGAKGSVDYLFEARLKRDFRDHLRAWLVANKIEVCAIEAPLQPTITRKKTVVNPDAMFAGQALQTEDVGMTQFSVVYRLYNLVGDACEICARLNIQPIVVPQNSWRKAFIGTARAPREASNSRQWFKDQAKKRCSQLGIEIRNGDQAEACGVVFWLQGHMQVARQGELISEAEARS